MKTQRNQSQSTRQKLYRQIITVLLLVQTILIGVNAENRIQQGDSTIEVLIWMINQCIPVLKQASSLQEKQKNSLSPTHRRSGEQ
ncbi:hypothetical protein [Calothrix sp. PCC 6303]|uniref:hypothetical protein n=1 Tax=Calothrix sp. PCC 6303 TaxID=1170562 RepID=UPI0002A0463F|nr:hypothetical protein [Calothrix sp. PCC 6303]AFZ02627.1 hypothetical protein Cal6303_3703 [Calothrix sp. PCC 6303]